jgi:hypothetical protein
MPSLSKAQQQKILRFAESNMNLEGFVVPSKIKRECISLMNNTKSADEIINEYIAKLMCLAGGDQDVKHKYHKF